MTKRQIAGDHRFARGQWCVCIALCAVVCVTAASASADDDCVACGDTPAFPEAAAFLEAQGYPPGEFTVLVTWHEVSPLDSSQWVAGYRVRPEDGSPPFDLYCDADAELLDEAALGTLGIRTKNWNLRPTECASERVAGPVKSLAVPARAMGPALGVVPSIAVKMPPVDMEAIAREDESGAVTPSKGVIRTGVFRPLPKNVFADEGIWHAVPGGGRLWSARIHSLGAVGQRVHVQRIKLPQDATLVLYNTAQPGEAYDLRDAAYPGCGDVWSPTCFGESVTLECYVPDGSETVSFEVDRIAHMYKSLDALPWAKAAGACNLDVACYPEWATTALGVAGLGTIGVTGTLWCTGSLVVDTDPATDIPYVLTANHCVGGQGEASSLELYWLYQADSCGGTVPDPATVPRTTGGATYLMGAGGTGYTGEGNDFTFMRLSQAPPGGLAYLGWSTLAPPLATEVTCVHHPRGDYKRISFGTLTNIDNEFNTLYHEVVWHDGTTEPGSSGSPMFLTDTQQIIGQLWGGQASCYYLDGPDYYGRFDVTFPIIQSLLDPSSADPLIAFDQPAYSVGEADTTVTVTLALDRLPGAAVSVDYAVSSEAAEDGVDYESASGTLQFEGTIDEAVIDIVILSDTSTEGDEALQIVLSNPVGCILPAANPAVLTILDDDVDTDGDGLSDYDESNGTFGYLSNPNLVDSDDDGISDFDEVMGARGFVTDPMQPTALGGLTVPFFEERD